jgi:hypothetical protein
LFSFWFITCGVRFDCCGAVIAGFAIARPDAAIALAKPIGFLGVLRRHGRVDFFFCPCEVTENTSVSRRAEGAHVVAWLTCGNACTSVGDSVRVGRSSSSE